MTDYENKVRVRSCGLLIENDSLLLVELLSPITNEYIWTAPGGGVEFGETLKETVIREFKEETGLLVNPSEFLYRDELISDKFHAIEFYFRVEKIGGKLNPGIDPELKADDQIIRDVALLRQQDIQKLNVFPVYLKDRLWSDI